MLLSEQTITCSKSTIETLEKDENMLKVKDKNTYKHQNNIEVVLVFL